MSYTDLLIAVYRLLLPSSKFTDAVYQQVTNLWYK